MAQKSSSPAVPGPVAKEYRVGITKQQAQLYLDALNAAGIAQDRVNVVAQAMLAGRGVERAVNVRLDWRKPSSPFLVYLVLPEEEAKDKKPT